MKKFWTVGLAGLLILSLLAGCGSAASSQSASSEVSEAPASTAEAVSAEEAAPEQTAAQEAASVSSSEEALDLNTDAEATGGINTIAAREGGSDIYPVGDGSQTLSFMILDTLNTSLIESFAENKGFIQAEERTGVHIDFIEVNMFSYAEQLNMTIASGDYPDIMQGVHADWSGSLDSAIEQDIIIDLNDYKEYAPNYFYLIENSETISKDTATDSGARGVFYTIQPASSNPTFGMIVRQDWLDALNLEMPTTIDDYTEVLAAFKSEYNPDYPFWLANDGTTPLAYAFDIVPGDGSSDSLYFQIDGTVYFSPLEEGYKEYVQTMHDWYEAGYISGDYPTLQSQGQSSEYENGIAEGSIGISKAARDTTTSISLTLTGDFDPSEAYAPAVAPVKNEGDQVHLGQTMNIVDTGGCSIAATSENIQLAVQWFDFFYSEEGSMLRTWGIEGESYTYDEEGRVIFTDLILDNPDGTAVGEMKQVYCMDSGFGLLAGFGEGPTYGYDSPVLTMPEVWGGDGVFDGAYNISKKVSLTADESDEYSTMAADCLTYLSENLPKFILGERDMSEWDAFVEEMKTAFNTDRMIEIQQAALERYNQR